MSVPLAIYQDIINWAVSQQRSEAANGQPAALVPTVRKALLELHQLVKPAAPALPEPEIGDTDWISLLQRYRDANPDPSGTTIPYHEKPQEDSPSHLRRWFCYVLLYENRSEPLPVPDPSTGLVPSFSRKKDAKKYAAKCAVEWLVAEGFMPGNGKDLGSLKQRMTPIPPQKRQRTNEPSPPTPRTASAAGSERAPPPTAPARSAKPLAPFESDQNSRTPSRSSSEGPNIIKQVADLCRTLGTNAPEYICNREHDDFFSGYAKLSDIFEDRGLPPDFGHVSSIYGGKKNVKEAVAEVLLRELREIEAERNSLIDEIFRDMPPPVG